jgi:hypothetical protein
MKSDNLYIIGLGKHVKEKLIPVIENLDIKIDGIVSKNTNHNYARISIEHLNNIADSGNSFIISGAPENHSELLEKLKSKDANILIEKPMFVDSKTLYKNKNQFINNKLTEAMMYKFNLAFRYSRYLHKLQPKQVKCIFLKFILPLNLNELKKSFRYTHSIKNSIIYDIGYYILDLVWSLDVNIVNINTKSVSWFPEKILEKIMVELECANKFKNYMISFEIGYGDDYQNQMKMTFNNKIISIDPIFSGREGNVNIVKHYSGYNTKVKKRNTNSYEKMIKYWYSKKLFRTSLGLSNYQRFKNILLNLKKIEEQVESNDFKAQ